MNRTRSNQEQDIRGSARRRQQEWEEEADPISRLYDEEDEDEEFEDEDEEFEDEEEDEYDEEEPDEEDEDEEDEDDDF